MNSAFALFPPALLLSLVQPVPGPAAAFAPPEEQSLPGAPPEGWPLWEALFEAFRPEPQEQVRIERRVIVRISPRAPMQDALVGGPHRPPPPRRFEERRMGKCVAIRDIGGVQISQQDRLLLFMRDRRIVSARLEKSCSVKDFYSGFYVEDSEDGMICAGRDTLHSRAGVNCSVAKLHRLVPADD